jgi:hypothetical protein
MTRTGRYNCTVSGPKLRELKSFIRGHPQSRSRKVYMRSRATTYDVAALRLLRNLATLDIVGAVVLGLGCTRRMARFELLNDRI